MFRSVQRTRSLDDIVTQIEDAISAGQLKPGDRLPSERVLCERFGVSRPTLREALRALEATGLVEVRLGAAGGVFATEPGGQLVGSALEGLMRLRGATAHELAEFRVSFEGENAFYAAHRADAHDLEELDQLTATARAMAKQDSPWPTMADVDVRFHETLARATQNTVRHAIMLGIARALQRAVVATAPMVTRSLKTSVGEELAAITEAIRAGRADDARVLVSAHVAKWSELEIRAPGARGHPEAAGGSSAAAGSRRRS